MRKFITTVVMMAICSTTAYAQDNTQSDNKASRKAQREERVEKMSPERKQHMAERKEKFKALPPEKQKAAKTEMKRHREEMKKITGEDFGGRHAGKHHENPHNKKDSAAK